MPRLLNLEHLDDGRLFESSYSPFPILLDGLLQPCDTLLAYKQKWSPSILTVEEGPSEIDADVPIPGGFSDLLDLGWDTSSVDLFHAVDNALLVTESDDDGRHAE